MTVSTTLAKITYSGNGVTKVWPFPFKLLDADDLQIVITDAAGAESVQATNYSVSGVGADAGGAVTYPVSGTPLSGTHKITLRRSMALLQSVDLANQGGFYAEVHEQVFDRLVMQDQQLEEQAARALKLPISTTIDSYETPLPEAGRALKWKADLSGLENSAADVDAIAATAAGHAAAAASSASDAAASAAAADASADAAAGSASAASGSAGTAAASASAASASAGAASTSASAAATSETNAAVSAAKLSGTSTSSVAIGTGSKSFTTQSGKFFGAGSWLLITSDADATNYMHGQVTAYSGTALTVDVTNTGGSGTKADWTIRLAGTRGATGATGATGPTGAQGPQGNPGTGDASTTVANVFTQDQTIRSTDAGAGEGPLLTLDRDSASPAANDLIGAVAFKGRDSGANTETYAKILAQILDPANGSEDAILALQTIVAGAMATRVSVGQGLYMAGATGGDPGPGKINAAEVQVNGVPLAGLFNTGYASGRFYGGLGGYIRSASGGPVSTNRIYIQPFYVGTSATFDRMQVNVTSSGAGFGRLGIYNIANGLPNSLVLDAGTVDVSGTGQKTVTISQALKAGWYGLAYLTNVSHSVTVSPSSNAFVSYVWGQIFGAASSDLGTGGNTVMIYGSQSYGALPSIFPTATYGELDLPVIMMRAV